MCVCWGEGHKRAQGSWLLSETDALDVILLLEMICLVELHGDTFQLYFFLKYSLGIMFCLAIYKAKSELTES